MKTTRVIARLDIKGPNLVKGIHLEGLRVLGKPEDFAKYYYDQGADELIYQDVVASLYDRNSLHEIVSRTASQIFIPLTVAGGIRTIEDIKTVLRAGADKVSINTAAIRKPEFIMEAANKFGSSTIVIAIEAIRQPNGEYLVFVDNGREHTGVEVVNWAQKVQAMGAGEILLTSVDRDGTGLGYDNELVQLITNAVSLPVIAHGGAGKLDHFKSVIQNSNADAVMMASMIHYDCAGKLKGDMANSKEGNLSFLESGRASFNKIEAHGIPEIKKYLLENNINCRN